MATTTKSRTKIKGTKESEIELAARKYKRITDAFFTCYHKGDKWRMQLTLAEIDKREAHKELDILQKQMAALNQKRKDYEKKLSVAESDKRKAHKELDVLQKQVKVLNQKRKDYENELKRRGILFQVYKRTGNSAVKRM